MGSFLCVDHSPKVVAAASVFYALRVTGLTKNPRYKASWVQEFPEKEMEGACTVTASRVDIIARRKFIADLTRRDPGDHTRSPTVLCEEEKPRRESVAKRPHAEEEAEKRPHVAPSAGKEPAPIVPTVPLSAPQPLMPDRAPLMPAHSPAPLIPSNSPAPLIPSNSPAPLIPSNSPAPLIPSNSPAPLIPTNSPAPLIPTNSPAPLIPSNSPAPLIPSNYPAPLFPAPIRPTETPVVRPAMSRQASTATPAFTMDVGLQDEPKNLFSFPPSIGTGLL